MFHGKQPKGFTLIEMILVVALMAAAATWQLNQMKRETDEARARDYGAKIAQYAQAIREYLINNPSVSPGATVIITGVDWLKMATCPGLGAGPADINPPANASALAYLPCNFPDVTGLPSTAAGADERWSVTVTNVAASPWNPVATSGFVGIPCLYDAAGACTNTVRPDLSGWAIRSAKGTVASTTENPFLAGASGIMTYYTGADDGGVDDSGRSDITVVMTSSSGADIFLRRDGSNGMTGDLDMGGNDINNVKDLTMGGTLTTTGNMAVGGNLAVTGSTTTGSLGVTGASTLAGTLGVTGASTLTNTTINGNVAVNGASVLRGNLNVQNGGGADQFAVDTATGNTVTTGTASMTAGQVTGVTIGGVPVSLGQATVFEGIYENASVIAKPSCGTQGAPRIYVRAAMFSNGVNAEPPGAVRTWAQDMGASWTVYIALLQSDGWHGGDVGLAIPPGFARVSVGVKCG